MATDVAGVFACGDVQDQVYRQAVTAAGSRSPIQRYRLIELFSGFPIQSVHAQSVAPFGSSQTVFVRRCVGFAKAWSVGSAEVTEGLGVEMGLTTLAGVS